MLSIFKNRNPQMVMSFYERNDISGGIFPYQQFATCNSYTGGKKVPKLLNIFVIVIPKELKLYNRHKKLLTYIASRGQPKTVTLKRPILSF